MHTLMRLTTSALVVTLVGLPAVGRAKDGDLDDAARRRAAERGVAFLEQELPRLLDSSGTPRKPFTQAITGLCFLLDGQTSDSGRVRIVKVKDALLRYLDDVAVRIDDPDELPERAGAFSSDRLIQYTWPVAAAGLFFGEMYERGLYRADARDALTTVVDLLERSQQKNGGWGHHIVAERPGDGGDDAQGDSAADRLRKELEKRFGKDVADRMNSASAGGGGYPDTLVSASDLVGATLGLLHGLLGKDAVKGLPAACTYFRDAALDDGTYPYDPGQRSAYGDPTSPGRTAGALWAWQSLGMPRDEQWRLSRDYVLGRLDDVAEGHGSPCLNLLYAAFATQAIGKDEFHDFRVASESRIIATQQDDGSLHCICRKSAPAVTCDSDDPFGGAAALFTKGQVVYTTALDTLVLLLPDRPPKITGRIPRARAAPAVTPR